MKIAELAFVFLHVYIEIIYFLSSIILIVPQKMKLKGSFAYSRAKYNGNL